MALSVGLLHQLRKISRRSVDECYVGRCMNCWPTCCHRKATYVGLVLQHSDIKVRDSLHHIMVWFQHLYIEFFHLSTRLLTCVKFNLNEVSRLLYAIISLFQLTKFAGRPFFASYRSNHLISQASRRKYFHTPSPELISNIVKLNSWNSRLLHSILLSYNMRVYGTSFRVRLVAVR